MYVAESIKFVASTWFFLRAFGKGVIHYLNDSKPMKQDQLRGLGVTDNKPLPKILPSAVEIKNVLPRHCFQASLSTSLYYALRDVVMVVGCFLVVSTLHQLVPQSAFYWPSMLCYWVIQGTLLTAVFVVGHDCGHGSFSRHTWLNDIIGNILHAFLLVPYYMWKLSHKNHHKNNANFDKDEVFYPVKKSERSTESGMLPGFGFGAGWYIYLVRGYKPRSVYHYDVLDPMFAGHLFNCLASMFCLFGMVVFLYKFWMVYGFVGLVNYYVVPTLGFGSFIVIITFLHHSEMGIPWYADDQWDFVRGQLSTIDRNYGIVHNIIHNIGTHQMHHMFIKIPHYHLEEATQAFRKAYPDLVRTCDEPIMSSFLRMFAKYDKQSSIEDDAKVHYYK